LIDNAEFRELIKKLDPRYKIPHCKKLGIEIEYLYSSVKRKILAVCGDGNLLTAKVTL